jgi:hypothetical protein
MFEKADTVSQTMVGYKLLWSIGEMLEKFNHESKFGEDLP